MKPSAARGVRRQVTRCWPSQQGPVVGGRDARRTTPIQSDVSIYWLAGRFAVDRWPQTIGQRWPYGVDIVKISTSVISSWPAAVDRVDWGPRRPARGARPSSTQSARHIDSSSFVSIRWAAPVSLFPRFDCNLPTSLGVFCSLLFCHSDRLLLNSPTLYVADCLVLTLYAILRTSFRKKGIDILYLTS